MSTTPRTDAAQWGTGKVTTSFARQLETELIAKTEQLEKFISDSAASQVLANEQINNLQTELIALQEENKTLRAAQRACETCDTVVYDQAIKERDQLLATVEGLREALTNIAAVRDMITTPTIDCLYLCTGTARDALQSLPPTNLVKRSVLEKCVEALSDCYEVVDYPANGRTIQDKALKEAHEELERTK